MKRGKSKGLNKSARINEAEAKFYTCPKGHKLPHETNAGQCTPIACAGSYGATKAGAGRTNNATVRAAKKELKVRVSQVADATLAKLPHDERKIAMEQKADELAKVSHAAGRHAARRAFLNVPDGLHGNDAETWADEKLIDMLPDAAAEIEFQLKFGDAEQRRMAAKQVLDSTGRGKIEKLGQASSPILIINADNIRLPWEKARPQLPAVSVTVDQVKNA